MTHEPELDAEASFTLFRLNAVVAAFTSNSWLK